MGRVGETSAHQRSGDQSCTVSLKGMDIQATRLSSESAVRQCYGGSIYKSPRGHEESSRPEGGELNFPVGRGTCAMHLGNFYSRSGQFAGGLLESPAACSGGMITPSPGLSGDLPKIGISGRRHHGIEVQQEAERIHVPDEGSSGLWYRCVGLPLASVQTSVCLPSVADVTPPAAQDQGREQTSHSDSPVGHGSHYS